MVGHQGNSGLSHVQVVAYGTGGVIPIALFHAAGQLLGVLGNISLGLSAITVGLILFVPRLWDAFSDLMVGHLSDRFYSRWGRRKPLMIVGGLFAALSFSLLWRVPSADLVGGWFGDTLDYSVVQAAYILLILMLFFTFSSLFDIPHSALGVAFTNSDHSRTRLFAAKSFFGNLGAMAMPWMLALATIHGSADSGHPEFEGMAPVSLAVSGILVALIIWWCFRLPEPTSATPRRREKRSTLFSSFGQVAKDRNFLHLGAAVFLVSLGFNIVTLFWYYIPIFYLYQGNRAAASLLIGANGTTWAIAGLVGTLLLTRVGKHVSKTTLFRTSILLMALAQVLKVLTYSPEHPYLLLVSTILLSLGMVFFYTLATALAGDAAQAREATGKEVFSGRYLAVNGWSIKISLAISSLLTGLVLSSLGADAFAASPHTSVSLYADQIDWLVYLDISIPIVCCLAALWITRNGSRWVGKHR